MGKLRLRAYPHPHATKLHLKAALFTSLLVGPKLELTSKIIEKLKTVQGKGTLLLKGCQPESVTHESPCSKVSVTTGQHFSDDVAATECTSQIFKRVCHKDHGRLTALVPSPLDPPSSCQGHTSLSCSQPMTEHRGSESAAPLLPNLGLLLQVTLVQGLPISMAGTFLEPRHCLRLSLPNPSSPSAFTGVGGGSRSEDSPAYPCSLPRYPSQARISKSSVNLLQV